MPPLSWRCKVLFVLSCSISWFLLPAACTFISHGNLIVEPPVPFLAGSNLTLHCDVDNCGQSHIYLSIVKEGGSTVKPWRLVNCRATFSLPNVRDPELIIYCMRRNNGADYIVTGITLRSGFPPDKAQNLRCETTRKADHINCTWDKGKSTYVRTTYNITIQTESGSLVRRRCDKDDSCSVPRKLLDGDLENLLFVSARNHFEESRSDPLTFRLRDIIVPETPRITHVDFSNTSLAASLRWNTSEAPETLEPYVRTSTGDNHWEKGEASELGEGLVRVTGLKPLTKYQFQVKTCVKTTQQRPANPRSDDACSQWSESFSKETPGKGPSEPLSVWRASGVTHEENGRPMVTVFWKPPPADDFSGEVHLYEILLDDGQKLEEVCAALTHCSARVPLLPTMSVRAVTTYGVSPPATVPLTLSGAPGPVWGAVTPAEDGSSVTVSWTWPEQNDGLMNYVTEWTAVPPVTLQWKAVSKHQRDATVPGLEPGVLYNISLYAVTTRGVSTPSSSLIYSKELEPTRGPAMSVLAHGSRRVLVKWDELPVEQRRGVIMSYTIYYKVLDSGSSQLIATERVPGPRERWLDCPDGTLALQMSASTAAGEGPKGNLISSHPPAAPVGLVIVIIFIITLFVAIMVNLMCWKCVRRRIKQRCIAWGPEWLGDDLPNLNNSNAIKMLQDRSEPSLFSSNSDPPLSPIVIVDEEEPYPCVRAEPGPCETTPASPASDSTADSFTAGSHPNYRPQPRDFFFADKADMEDLKDAELSPGGPLDGLLSKARVDLSDGTVICSWWPQTTKMNIASMEIRTSSDGADTKSVVSLLDSEASADDVLQDFSDKDIAVLAGGYFPQLFSPVCPT